MSAYPSTATLAAFRASLLPLSLRATGGPVTDPAAGGAWSHERAEGIGMRPLGYALRHSWGRTAASMGEHHHLARREASAMRSRAFGISWYGAMEPEKAHGTPTAAWADPTWWDCAR